MGLIAKLQLSTGLASAPPVALGRKLHVAGRVTVLAVKKEVNDPGLPPGKMNQLYVLAVGVIFNVSVPGTLNAGAPGTVPGLGVNALDWEA